LHVIYWSGLRGAVSTALALSLPADLPNRSMLQGITFGVVLFTLLVQATTAELVVDRWAKKPARPPKSKASAKTAEPRSPGPEAPEPRSPEPKAAGVSRGQNLRPNRRSDLRSNRRSDLRPNLQPSGRSDRPRPDGRTDERVEAALADRLCPRRRRQVSVASRRDPSVGARIPARQDSSGHERGFSPRPRLIFAAPLPLGMLAEHELADVFLAERLTRLDLANG